MNKAMKLRTMILMRERYRARSSGQIEIEFHSGRGSKTKRGGELRPGCAAAMPTIACFMFLKTGFAYAVTTLLRGLSLIVLVLNILGAVAARSHHFLGFG